MDWCYYGTRHINYILMKSKIKVAIIFGGKSAEHEVSLQSAKNVVLALDRKKYKPVLIAIDKKGVWFLVKEKNFLLNSDNPKSICLNTLGANKITVNFGSEKQFSIYGGKTDIKVDVVFPVLHGVNGEDGTMQGLLKILNVPFVGPGVLGSAAGMDKDVAKRLWQAAGIPVAKCLVIKKSEKKNLSFPNTSKQLGLPFFVKPANAGSSVGVSKVKTEKDFTVAIVQAFKYDSKILIEEFIKGREIEVAILGNEKPKASVTGEVIPHHEFYSYEAKYIDQDGAGVEIPAKLAPALVKKIQASAIQAFELLECQGLARVDFFVTSGGLFYVNEINTIPGFTNISMYPKLWEASGIKYSDLLDRLIDLAIERYAKELKQTTKF